MSAMGASWWGKCVAYGEWNHGSMGLELHNTKKIIFANLFNVHIIRGIIEII